ncbi:MAG TPA: type I DNA topoisomerase, partial [Dissulfuribacter thermophilus]|nr:type I DNA topoisomerase [Dissulfuribacter thermophilus]
MKKGLVIVESPTKARTLSRYLGRDFAVKASVGHIKDLPKKELGVDVDNGFTPKYVVIHGKGKVIKELKQAAQNAEEIYLAPDPDREGEAIAWHIAEELQKTKGKPRRFHRVLFKELTKKGIQEAMSHPVELDPNKYESQKARRVLDRLVGYEVSPLLWQKVKSGLSAGRVQSVALRLICEREKEIRAFRPEEYWTIDAQLKKPQAPPPFKARLQEFKGEKLKISDEKGAKAISKELEGCRFEVQSVQTREVKRNPPPPFITSTLQQEASRRLRFSAKKTMQIAQRLYEGVEIGEEGPVGLITYMRTDSTRVSDEAIKAARTYIAAQFGEDYVEKGA